MSVEAKKNGRIIGSFYEANPKGIKYDIFDASFGEVRGHLEQDVTVEDGVVQNITSTEGVVAEDFDEFSRMFYDFLRLDSTKELD